MTDGRALALRFRQLCEQAARETDHTKLKVLARKISRLSDEREKTNKDSAKRKAARTG